jgi:hypothetical protein
MRRGFRDMPSFSHRTKSFPAMPLCKSCRKEIDPSQAAASLFDLSFLPVKGRRQARYTTKRMAKAVGPLCSNCLKRRTDLAIRPGK